MTPTSNEDGELQRLWPLYGLRIAFAGRSLSLPSWTDLAILLPIRAAEIEAISGLNKRYQEWALLQGQISTIANWQPTAWHLALCVRCEGKPVGIQGLRRTGDADEVATDSWIAPTERSKGHATAAREAVLRFAHEYLNALTARARSWPQNTASTRVNQKIGYDFVSEVPDRKGRREIHWRLDLPSWATRRSGQIRMNGFNREVRFLLGVTDRLGMGE